LCGISARVGCILETITIVKNKMRPQRWNILSIGAFFLTVVAAVSWAQNTNTHSATIKWAPQKLNKKAHESERIEHYVVYRADGDKKADGTTTCRPAFEKIGQVDAPATSYTDSKVTAGHIYCYKVAALRAGLESVASPPSVAVIPPDTNGR
jgi:hypothetical protein